MSSSRSGSVPSAPELIETLLSVTHAIRREHNSRLASVDASIPRGRLLRAMTELGRPKMSELAANLGLNARTITTSVDALEKEGLLRREAHPTDRRATLVELTPKGRAYVEDWQSFQRELAEAAMSPLTEQDRRDLMRILATVGSQGLARLSRVASPGQSAGTTRPAKERKRRRRDLVELESGRGDPVRRRDRPV
jgi:DNA-binding MarR family transcriptional regulator